jgi:selenocysteine-specific elongation factor
MGTVPASRVIVGTAGHVDHGKTRLIEALTGIDCDRWAEEKARGITIDLGFAHLEHDGLQIGFIDVPGHQRFLHNALAGLGGIRVVLLVVAADEGIQPQTREHLEICTLLEIPAAVVALTKADRVDDETLGLVRLEVEELLAATPLTGAPILAVSSTHGQGIDQLREALVELARRHAASSDAGSDTGPPTDIGPGPDHHPERPTRLPIDRAFQLQGLGTIVTGTLVEGALRPGDELELLPGGDRANVRSVEVHGRERSAALRGERTALQITGLDIDRLGRGRELVAPGAYAATTSLIARFRLSPTASKAIRGSTPIRFHLYAAEVTGRLRPLAGPIEPGAAGPVELRLEGAVVAARGDRFIVRRPSPAATLGGGRILDPQGERRRGDRLRRALGALAGDDLAALALWAEERGEAGLQPGAAARLLGRDAKGVERDLDHLVAESKLLAMAAGHTRRYLAPRVYRRVSEHAELALRAHHAGDRLSRGMSKAEIVQRILPPGATDLGDVYLEWLAAQGILAVDGDRVRLPDAAGGLSEKESALAKVLADLYRAAGLTPPSPASLGRDLGAKSAILEGVVRYLVERGRLLRLPGGLVISPDPIAEVARDLRSSGWERFSVPQFKERFGLSRKWAIPILEHLDSTGVTQRIGNERWIRPAAG